MEKTDKLNEVIAFMKANPGKSNNWYSTHNGVVSRATFFRLLGEIETAVSKNETAIETAIETAVSKNETTIETAIETANETANETAVSKNETAIETTNETAVSKNETAEKEWWEEEEPPTHTDILKAAGITPQSFSPSFEKPVTTPPVEDNLYFENDDPQTRREKKRIADNEVRRAQQIVAERKRREANGEFPDYASCKVFLDKFFSFEKAREMSLHDILKILRQRRPIRKQWLARYMSENGIDGRNAYEIEADIDRENGRLDVEKRDLERTDYLSTHEDNLENRVEYLMSFVKMEERFDPSKVREVIRKAVTEICPDRTLVEMTANPDGCRSFVSDIVNRNRTKINIG